MAQFLTINTLEGQPFGGAHVEGFQALAGTLLDLSIEAGRIDGRIVAADTSVSVTAATTTWRAFLVSEDGAGAFVVTMGADDSGATGALALADGKEKIDVPAGDTAIFIGAVDDTTTVAAPKDYTVKGKTAAVSADF